MSLVTLFKNIGRDVKVEAGQEISIAEKELGLAEAWALVETKLVEAKAKAEAAKLKHEALALEVSAIEKVVAEHHDIKVALIARVNAVLSAL